MFNCCCAAAAAAAEWPLLVEMALEVEELGEIELGGWGETEALPSWCRSLPLGGPDP